MELSQDLMAATERINSLEEIVTKMGTLLTGARKGRFPKSRQTNLFNVMSRALCVETIDPWKENRVRYYHPIMHNPKDPILSMPFARPISSLGGFDDCGVNWVPPAGSTLCIIFEMGDREAAYYLGTTWQKNRGPHGSKLGYTSREWDNIYSGHRYGYLIPPDDESQCYAPWNTESYNGHDIENILQFIGNQAEQNSTTYPNIYGFKTPEKHMLKMVDGNAKCNRRWKRMELMSGCGNWMIFKDDHLHYGGQWAHPSCNPTPGGPDVSQCNTNKAPVETIKVTFSDDPNNNTVKLTQKFPYLTDVQGQPIESTNCDGDHSPSNIIQGHPSTGGPATPYPNTNTGTNPFFKHANECRPYKGPGTPQNNSCDLPQSGIQLLSISGHTIVMSDAVKEPSGKPTWERSMQSFDFGCDNTFEGLFYIKSATGHSFTMSDVESHPTVRGEYNFIELKTATGNILHMNDHTEPKTPIYAGQKRGITLKSTSNHVLQFCDSKNLQVGPIRKEGGAPQAQATEAFVTLQSGYGHLLQFKDYPTSQTETKEQFIHLENPQCSKAGNDPQCNKTRGNHFLRLQGKPEGTPGIVMLRCGGYHLRTTTDMDIVMVGSKEMPADKFTYVSKDYTDATMGDHFRYAGKNHLFFAEQKIVLMAGRDCPPPPGSKCPGPCVYSVIVSRCPVICPLTGILHWTEKAMSQRVFASAYHPCQPPDNCCGGWTPTPYDPEKCAEKKPPVDLGFGTIVAPQTPPNSVNVDSLGYTTMG